MDIYKTIDHLNKLVSQYFDSFEVSYLYGSYAKGTFTSESDIDVVLIFKNNLSYDQELKLAGFVGEVEYKEDVFIDYHPYTREELKRNPIYYQEVVDKGICFG